MNAGVDKLGFNKLGGGILLVSWVAILVTCIVLVSACCSVHGSMACLVHGLFNAPAYFLGATRRRPGHPMAHLLFMRAPFPSFAVFPCYRVLLGRLARIKTPHRRLPRSSLCACVFLYCTQAGKIS